MEYSYTILLVWSRFMGDCWGSKISLPINQDNLRKWKIKTIKVMYALSISIEDGFLQRIKDVKTLKEA